jgi:acetyl esterase
LAAAVALMARDRNGPSIQLQVLVYPVTNYSDDTPSHQGTGEGYFLRSAEVMWYWKQYLADEGDGADPYASPLRAGDLSALPPALVITAEYDPLRDEGEAYGHRLDDAGVSTVVHRYDGMFHSFVSFLSVLDAADEALTEIAVALRAAFARVSGPAAATGA